MAEQTDLSNTVAAPEALGVAFAQPVGVFQGYDSVSGRGLSTALTGTTKRVGGTSTVSYRVCTDLETLSNALEIDQSLSVSFGPIGSLDQKLKFVKNLKVTTYSVSIVVYARHLQGSDVSVDVALKPGFAPPKGDAALRDFFRSYGDAFLSSVSEGGEYYAVYTYYSETRDEQSELTASMKAHGIFQGGSVDASLQTKISSFSSKAQTRMSLDQNMSGLSDPKFPPSDRIIEFALTFPSLPLTAPAIIGFDTLGYERVPQFGDFQPVANNRSFFVGDGVIGGLTRPLVQINELQNQIAWLETVYAFYGGYSDAKVADTKTAVELDRDKINALIEQYQSDPTGSFARPDLPSLKNGTPSLEYSIDRSPAYGGDGGDPFDDVNVDTFIAQQTRIASLQLRSGGRVDKLIVTYRDASGTRVVEHGRDGGSLGAKLDLRQGQSIVKVSGRSGARVDRLKLTANSGGEIEGGRDGGGPFGWEVPKDSFMLGFAGRSGAELDKIQFITGKFQPAIWTPLPPT